MVFTASLSVAGCLSDDIGSSSARESRAPSQPVAWNTSIGTEVGCLVGAGHYTGGVFSYACQPGPDFDPCSQVDVPDGTEALTFEIEPEPVDTDAPGVGEYAVSVWGPPDADWKQVWTAPLETVTFEVEEPQPGEWGVNVIAQGATVAQAWDVTAEASGEAAPGDVPELEFESCTSS